ncbi:MAG TPA: efflux RND transporter periplasmic adaptor subunit [Bryobacteraceae bacterium]|nr:efflux RND transporter periplasmic adaptor subunit [Bryobacteraceae bacterium]
MKKVIFIVGSVLLVAGCGRERPAVHAEQEQQPETIAVTNWTDKTELFMEYQPLVTTAKRRFAIHFTDLSNFKPLTKGTVTVALKQDGGAAQTFTVEGPSRPGIFGLDVQPARPGAYGMSVSLDAPGIRDTHEVGEVKVYASEREIQPAAEEPDEEQVAFLKEQQWALDFATAIAATRSMRESVVVTGDVRPRSGGEVEVTAPVTGQLAATGRLPVIGTAVSQGDTLATVVPLTPAPADRPSLEFGVSGAKTALELARRDLARAERLLAVGAIPAKRVEEARATEATAAGQLKAAEQRLEQYEASRRADGSAGSASAFAVRAPITGIVAEVATIPGANVAQGDRLLRIVAVDRVYAAANVPEAEVPRLSRLTGAEIQVAGLERPIPAGRMVSRASMIDPRSRTLSVLYEVPNHGRTLAIGQSVSARLFLSGTIEAVAVPESAIVDDAGRPIVFIQTEGEAFVRRPVKVGVHEGNLVQIAEGLQAGERVVTKGAYLIRLAAMSSQIPAHGHVH